MKRILCFIIKFAFVQHLSGQSNDTICDFRIREHSFEKGLTYKLRVLSIFTDTTYILKDTLIDGKEFRVYKTTSHPTLGYHYEADDGSIWQYHPVQCRKEIIVIPAQPKVGYNVTSNSWDITITGLNITRTFGIKKFGQITYDNLVECEWLNRGDNKVYKKYFKKGVGWVATERTDYGYLTYVECIIRDKSSR
jgi:hypothetical protein